MSFADFLNTPHEIVYKDSAGKETTYRLAQLTKGGEARFARWLEKRARDDAARAINDMPADVAESYVAGTRQDIAAGVYGWGTAACVKALQTPDGQRYAIFLSLSDQHPEVDEELAGKIYEQQRQRIIDQLTQAVKDDDPKVFAALRSLMNLTGGPQSPSATRRSTGSRGKSKKQRRRK